VELDGEGKRLCRSCRANAQVKAAESVQRRHGARRRCRRCDTLTLVRGDPIQPMHISGGGPAGESSAPLTVAHSFRCTTCGAGTILVGWVGFVAYLIGAACVGGAIHHETGSWVAPIGFTAILLGLLLREVYLRLRFPNR
jgi:hypothetical protein